jgi:hypothetical protein
VLERAEVPRADLLDRRYRRGPHYQARGDVRAPPLGGRDRCSPGIVPKLSVTPGRTRWIGPRLGEHTDAVLASRSARSLQEIAALRGRAWSPGVESTRTIEAQPMRIYVNDVAVRDGFQIEKHFVPTATKVELINQLSRTGLHRIEVTSFVSPKAVPALADANEVLARIDRVPGVVYVALVPNIRGVQNARRAAQAPTS